MSLETFWTNRETIILNSAVGWCKEYLNVDSTGGKDPPKLNTLPELQNPSPENWLPFCQWLLNI